MIDRTPGLALGADHAAAGSADLRASRTKRSRPGGACMRAWRHVYLCPEKRSTSNSVMHRAQDRPGGWPMDTDGHCWDGAQSGVRSMPCCPAMASSTNAG